MYIVTINNKSKIIKLKSLSNINLYKKSKQYIPAWILITKNNKKLLDIKSNEKIWMIMDWTVKGGAVLSFNKNQPNRFKDYLNALVNNEKI